MGRFVLAVGLCLVAVGIGRMWWASAQLHGYKEGEQFGISVVRDEFDSGRGWLVWGAFITGIGIPRGRRAPGDGPDLPFAKVSRVRVMQDD